MSRKILSSLHLSFLFTNEQWYGLLRLTNHSSAFQLVCGMKLNMLYPAPVSGTKKIWHQKSMKDWPVSGTRNRRLKLASVSSLLDCTAPVQCAKGFLPQYLFLMYKKIFLIKSEVNMSRYYQLLLPFQPQNFFPICLHIIQLWRRSNDKSKWLIMHPQWSILFAEN